MESNNDFNRNKGIFASEGSAGWKEESDKFQIQPGEVENR